MKVFKTVGAANTGIPFKLQFGLFPNFLLKKPAGYNSISPDVPVSCRFAETIWKIP